jgi:hypothetical protein
VLFHYSFTSPVIHSSHEELCLCCTGLLDRELVRAKSSHISLCLGHGWGPGGSGQGQTNSRPAEWTGGAGRGPGPPADQEHICHQVCHWACFGWAPVLGPQTFARISKPACGLVHTVLHRLHRSLGSGLCVSLPPLSPLTHPSYSPHSYINQRNREWNIVESEKALVVSKTTLSGSLKKSVMKWHEIFPPCYPVYLLNYWNNMHMHLAYMLSATHIPHVIY